MTNKNFWLGKKVLITGDRGFLGSNLSRALTMRGAVVIGMDIKRSKKEDVGDYDSVEGIIKRNNIRIIYHLAAEAIVANVHKIPRRALITNICGTWNVLEATRVLGNIETVVIASSDKAYGEHRKLPYKEDYILLARYPYDVSKSCADALARSYYSSYGIPVVVTRCGNIYGLGDSNLCRLIPSAVNCFINKSTLEVRGYGKFVRDFVYVDDVVDAYIKIAENFKGKKLSGHVFNIGNEKPVSILELIKTMNMIVGNKLQYKLVGKASGEICKQYLDSSRAKRILGWTPQWTLERGLSKTLEGAIEYGAYR